MAKTGFFEATAGAVERLARFYDWFSPALIGLHRLRTSVTKSLREKDVDEKILESRFNKGSGIRWSAYHGLISKKWPDICSEAAYALINESCSVLEGWLEDVFSREVSNNVFMAFNDEGANSLRTKAIKYMQFPCGKECYKQVLKYLKANAPSSATFLCQSTVPALRRSLGAYTEETLENLLRYYRLIKELRNSVVHGGGFATKNCVGAYCGCKGLSSNDLGLTRLPCLPQIKEGQRVNIDLYTANAFVEVVLKIIKIYDIELVESRIGVEEFKRRWMSHQGNLVKTFSANQSKAEKQLSAWLKRFYGFKIDDIEMMRRFLSDEDLCKFG